MSERPTALTQVDEVEGQVGKLFRRHLVARHEKTAALPQELTFKNVVIEDQTCAEV